MDLSRLKNITNNYQDVRLISLSKWKRASEIEDRDHAGPYVIVQMGFDPMDAKMTPTEFLLGKSGEWITLGMFFSLPVEVRRQEFIFPKAGEVMQLMMDLPGQAKIIRSGKELQEEEASREAAELNAAVRQAVDEQRPKTQNA